MKRVLILFAIIFFATLLLPMIVMIKPTSQGSELVTLFNSYIQFLL